jgi:hypothetical protein
MWKAVPALFGLILGVACINSSQGRSKPLSVAALGEEYEKSTADVRRKYDGKEIVVRGYAPIPATSLGPSADQGSVFLEEKGSIHVRQLACWFSKDQASEFSKIKGSQYVTVKGIFNGEAGAELKFCKLVKIEGESD